MLLHEVNRVLIKQICCQEDTARVAHQLEEGEQSRLIQCFVVGEAQHHVKKCLGHICPT